MENRLCIHDILQAEHRQPCHQALLNLIWAVKRMELRLAPFHHRDFKIGILLWHSTGALASTGLFEPSFTKVVYHHPLFTKAIVSLPSFDSGEAVTDFLYCCDCLNNGCFDPSRWYYILPLPE